MDEGTPAPPPVAFLVVVADGAGVGAGGAEGLTFFFLGGCTDECGTAASSFGGLRFGIAPDSRRASGIGRSANFATISARCSRVMEMPLSAARLTMARLRA